MAIKLPRLMPKEEKFFDLFKDSAKNLLEGAEALKDLVNDYQDVEEKVKKNQKDRTSRGRDHRQAEQDLHNTSG